MIDVYKYFTKQKSGFTLPELMVAVFLLVTALLAIAGVFFAGASAIKKGAILSQASDIAYNEKVYLELYDFDKLVDGMTDGVASPPGSSTFFLSEYPKNGGNFIIECEQAIYSHPPAGNFYLLYVKLRVSNVSASRKATLSRSDYIEVMLDIVIPRNKN